MKQTLVVPIAVAGIAAAFAAAGALVWLSRGRIAALVRAKLFLGGLLLTLGVGGAACDDDKMMCYAPPRERDVVTLSSSHPQAVKADLTVRGVITDRQGTAFSFVLLSYSSGIEVARGTLEADDGAFDEWTEPFHLHVPAGTPAGMYEVRFFAEDATGPRLVGRGIIEVRNE
jgi:hypothetical protein